MGEKKHRELWKIEDVIKYLNVPRSTAYLYVAEGLIPCVKIGKHRRFIPDEVEKAVKRLP